MYCDTATVDLPSHLVLYVISACMLVTCTIFCALVWYVSSRSKERAPFAFKTQTREDQAFKHHFSRLQRSIQSPLALASELYSKGIITEDVRDRTILPNCNTLQERNGIMLIAVEQAISIDPQCFHHFVQILDDEPTTKLLSKMLLDTYSTRFTQSADAHTRHTYSTGINNTVLSDDTPNNGYRWNAPNIPKFETSSGTPQVPDTSASMYRSPPLLKFEGPLKSTSKKYQRLMTMCQNLHYQHRTKELKEAVANITSNDDVPLDIKTFMCIKNSIYSIQVQDTKGLIAECKQHDSQNIHLLEAYAHMTSSYVHSYEGDHHKAMEYIKQVRSQMCFEVEPSYLTCWTCYAEAVNITRINEGNLTTNVKKDIKRLFNRAIEFSYYGKGWERHMICICHI